MLNLIIGMLLGATTTLLFIKKSITPTIIIKKEYVGTTSAPPKEEGELPEPINMNGVIEALHDIMGVEHNERN